MILFYIVFGVVFYFCLRAFMNWAFDYELPEVKDAQKKLKQYGLRCGPGLWFEKHIGSGVSIKEMMCDYQGTVDEQKARELVIIAHKQFVESTRLHSRDHREEDSMAVSVWFANKSRVKMVGEEITLKGNFTRTIA